MPLPDTTTVELRTDTIVALRKVLRGEEVLEERLPPERQKAIAGHLKEALDRPV